MAFSVPLKYFGTENIAFLIPAQAAISVILFGNDGFIKTSHLAL